MANNTTIYSSKVYGMFIIECKSAFSIDYISYEGTLPFNSLMAKEVDAREFDRIKNRLFMTFAYNTSINDIKYYMD